jgi:hypothetical protein
MRKKKNCLLQRKAVVEVEEFMYGVVYLGSERDRVEEQ